MRKDIKKNNKTAKIIAITLVSIITMCLFALIMFLAFRKQSQENNEAGKNTDNTENKQINEKYDNKDAINSHTNVKKIPHISDPTCPCNTRIQKIPHDNIDIQDNNDKNNNNTNILTQNTEEKVDNNINNDTQVLYDFGTNLNSINIQQQNNIANNDSIEQQKEDEEQINDTIVFIGKNKKNFKNDIPLEYQKQIIKKNGIKGFYGKDRFISTNILEVKKELQNSSQIGTDTGIKPIKIVKH